MSRAKGQHKQTLVVEVSDEFKQLVVGLAQQNRRPISAELRLAVERHLAESGIKVPTMTQRKRGRPRQKVERQTVSAIVDGATGEVAP